MKYRTHKKTGDKISEIGMGTAYLFEAGMAEGVRALQRAYEGGINYFDLAAGHGDAYPIFGEAFGGAGGVRNNVLYQIHFGTEYTKGEYGWTLDLDMIKRSIDEQLALLKTDYIDYGFIHCLDTIADWNTYQENGILEYILELKKTGVVKHIAHSSHTPEVAQKVLDDTDAETLMFSINPAFDNGEGDYANGELDERAALYERCQKEGIGVTVMKPFAGGQLLDAAQSPFGTALTIEQCIHYALDRPGVLSVIAGARNEEDVQRLLAYHDKTEEELDYSIIGTFDAVDTEGRCTYCNHCKPCPVGIDIGLVNKYYDLAKAGDAMAREHYMNLDVTASTCIGCGHCNFRCPFKVFQSEKMGEIYKYFGK